MASHLMKPDPSPPRSADVKAEDVGEEDDDLEALRLAALKSMKPKKPEFHLRHQVRAHPFRSNLLSIVPVEEDRPLPPPPKMPPTAGQVFRPEEKKPNDKFSRFDRESESEESEYSEYSEYQSETDPEEEAEEAEKASKGEVKKETDGGADLKSMSTAAEEADDVLNVDCTDEVDEFSSLLKEFEEELLPGQDRSGKAKGAGEAKSAKKKKRVRVVKKRKKTSKPSDTSQQDTTSATLDTTQSSVMTSESHKRGSRSPVYRPGPARTPSPSRRRSPPPRFRDRSPIGGRGGRSPPRRRSPYSRGRSPSPLYRPSRFRRSPSPPGAFYRRGSSPPPSRRSPPFAQRRRTPPARRGSPSRRSPGHLPTGRGESAPRFPEAVRHSREKEEKGGFTGDEKSRSLPPRQQQRAGSGGKSSPEKERNGNAKQFEERLKKLSTPEREKLLARQQKFSQKGSGVATDKKVISLKTVVHASQHQPSSAAPVSDRFSGKVSRLISEDAGDAISLSVDDTLDMFEEEVDTRRKKAVTGATELWTKHSSKRPSDSTSAASVFDLRVQLHRKRRQQQLEPSSPPDDSLENASLEYSNENSDEEEGEITRPSSASKRLVRKPSSSQTGKGRQILMSQESVAEAEKDARLIRRKVDKTPSPVKRRSVMERLGEPVHNVISTEDSIVSKRQRVSSSTSSSPTKIGKKEKKKDKKKEKKEKKEKKAKKKKKSRKHHEDESHSGESQDDEENAKGDSIIAELLPVFDKDEEELLSFFETGAALDQQGAAGNQPTEDDLMLRMKRKNDVRLQRLKEIEEDKRRHK